MPKNTANRAAAYFSGLECRYAAMQSGFYDRTCKANTNLPVEMHEKRYSCQDNQTLDRPKANTIPLRKKQLNLRKDLAYSYLLSDKIMIQL